MRESIEIDASPEKIFDYISDLTNDPKWRPEVERMEVKGEKQIGTLVIEYITVYRFFRFVTPTEIKVLDRPARFVVETPKDHPTWVECIRSTEKTENGKSKFTVQLSFSLNNLKQVTPILPPSVLVRMWYVPRIRKYLKRLKRILESKES